MWSPGGGAVERVGKRRITDTDEDTSVHECMKRLRVTGSGAPSPAGALATINQLPPHPGLARSWAMAQASAVSPGPPTPSGAHEVQATSTFGHASWPPASQLQQVTGVHARSHQENVQPLPMGALASMGSVVPHDTQPPPAAAQLRPATQPLPAHQHHQHHQHYQHHQHHHRPDHLPAHAARPSPASAADASAVLTGTAGDAVAHPANYGHMNTLLSQLHAERVRAGARPRWTEAEDDDDDDDDLDDDL